MGNTADCRQYKGIAAAPGMAEGTSIILKSVSLDFPRINGCDYPREKGRIRGAVGKAINDLRTLSNSYSGRLSADEGEIFKAQAMMAEDPGLEQKYETALREGLNAEAAWMDAIEFYAEQLESLADPTLRARVADIRDIGRRVLGYLMNLSSASGLQISGPRVLIAEDLAPSETASLERSLIIAFCMARGGATSHTAILAKAMGIPAVVGLGELIMETPDGTDILVDGHTGVVTLNPDSKMREVFRRYSLQQNELIRSELSKAAEPATTIDNHNIKIAANVGSLSDTYTAIENGAEGIGLFRTEFLFLERNVPPDEETQYQFYRQVFSAMKDLSIVVRTLDAGGDKEIPYLDTGRENNPFLGWRSIRICLENTELFRTQLRALLRAGAGHDLSIMFPMITHLEELRQAKAHVATAQQELASRNIPFKENARVGIMIETPAAVVMADQLAREASFFSIGTNDLTQYTMAADRTNERVASLNDACHPAIFRQIKKVIATGQVSGIPTGICGELAGDPEAIPILLGLGADELSMSPFSIPGAKSLIRSLSLEKLKMLARKALEMETADEVRAYIKNFIQEMAH